MVRLISPILLPITQSYGLSTVHFGIIIAYLTIGLITPSLGVAYVLHQGRCIQSKRCPKRNCFLADPYDKLLDVQCFVPAISVSFTSLVGDDELIELIREPRVLLQVLLQLSYHEPRSCYKARFLPSVSVINQVFALIRKNAKEHYSRRHPSPHPAQFTLKLVEAV